MDARFRKPPDFPGDGIRMLPLKFGVRAGPRRVRRRYIVVEGTVMTAFDAHELLDATVDLGRPGLPY